VRLLCDLAEAIGQTAPFRLTEISRCDERGPAWSWDNITTGELALVER
jgi:hypothetical protein